MSVLSLTSPRARLKLAAQSNFNSDPRMVETISQASSPTDYRTNGPGAHLSFDAAIKREDDFYRTLFALNRDAPELHDPFACVVFGI